MLINYDTVINKLSTDLDIQAKRSELIASNIANLDTPGYKARDLNFKEQLFGEIGRLNMKQTHPKHMADSSSTSSIAEVVEDANAGRPDGNNVNVDDEMLKLTENNIQYNVVVQLISKSLTQIRNAIDLAR